MEFINVESSNVQAIAWKDENLFVKFHSGAIYKYENVSSDIFQDFLNASSKGKFLNCVIKKKNYKYQKL